MKLINLIIAIAAALAMVMGKRHKHRSSHKRTRLTKRINEECSRLLEVCGDNLVCTPDAANPKNKFCKVKDGIMCDKPESCASGKCEMQKNEVANGLKIEYKTCLKK